MLYRINDKLVCGLTSHQLQLNRYQRILEISTPFKMGSYFLCAEFQVGLLSYLKKNACLSEEGKLLLASIASTGIVQRKVFIFCSKGNLNIPRLLCLLAMSVKRPFSVSSLNESNILFQILGFSIHRKLMKMQK